MDHKSWTARDGAPQGVTALAQDTDGILWIGTEDGLYNFDGHSFRVFQPRSGEADLPAGAVQALLATRDGTIWVGFRHEGVARIAQGRVERFTRAEGLALTWVPRIQQSSDGTLWALQGHKGLIRFGADGAWRKEPTPLGDLGGRLTDIFIDSSDTLWLGQGGRLYRRPLNQHQYFVTDAQTDWLFGFAELPDQSLWVNDSITDAPGHPLGRTQHVDRFGKVLARLPFTSNVRDLLYAPDGSLIVLADGVLRIAKRALTDPALLGRVVPDDVYEKRNDLYDQKSGLSSDKQRALLLDADGNIWAGGQRGLDRFAKARLVPFTLKYGMDDPNLCAGKNGDLWITAGGTKEQLYRVSSGSTKLLPASGQVYSMSCGPDGDTWLMANNGIFNIHADRITSIPSIPGTRPFQILQIVAAPGKILFASVASEPDLTGLWQFAGRWTKVTGAKIPPSAPTAEYVDSRGRIVTGYVDGQIGLPLEGGGKLLSAGNPGIGAVYAILETTHGVLAAGVNGLAVLRTDRVEMLDFADPVSFRGVGGILESTNGDLWLNAMHGVVHVPAAELQSALTNPQFRMKAELITQGDFGGPIELSPGMSSTAQDSEGKLWFATMNGVFHIDPKDEKPGGRLPNLSIRAITADGKPVSNGGTVGLGSATLDIQYLGVNLTRPESVSYRYRLDGFENAWQDVGQRSEAIYSQLRPGRYTFRVMASNGDGIWTKVISSASFEVLPRFYQSAWFAFSCAGAVLALIWMIWQLRLRQLQRHHDALNQSRLELTHVERLATLSTMTASITHEVSQPISGILTNAHTCVRMLTADPPNVEGATETARRTIRDANRASEVIKRLRALFMKKTSTIESVDLNDAARDVIALSAAELRRSGAVLQTDFGEPLPAVTGDRVQLQQVILNLLLNAADAMAGIDDRPRTLRVQTESRGGDRIELLVRDSGIGLDPRGIEKLFEAFHTTKAHGLGIGLAVSRSIIESHKGRLWATANDGPGATFGFSIPTASGVVTDGSSSRRNGGDRINLAG